MKNELVVEFQCPQCGAPANLKETSRVFICKYCHVKSYLIPRQGFQYVLPSRGPDNRETIYFPYWRFRGVLFICDYVYSIHAEVIDETLQATESDSFPFDLGSKIKLLKIRFTGPDTKGRIFVPTISLDEAVNRLKTNYPSDYHSEFIGSLDLIYAPFYVHDGTLYDATYNKRVDAYWDKKIKMTKDVVNKLPPTASLQQKVKFVPTLCPDCGWDTDCARDSYLLACRNCSSFWKPQWEGLKRLGLSYLPGEPETALYLPFWRVRADITKIQLDTYADLIKVANLFKPLREDYAQTDFHFWIPAFRISSHLYLQIAKRVTISQPRGQLEHMMPEAPAYPVTLPMTEAQKSLKTLLADFISFPEVNYPKLGGIKIKPKRSTLIYLPFHAAGSEFIHPEYKVRVSRRTLEHFRKD
jgi:hypothetical protein